MNRLEAALESNNPSHIQSIQKAIIIIELLANEKSALSLTQISKKLGWPKSTVHGIISTLREFHYIQQVEETGFYYLGSRLFELGSLVARQWDIRNIAHPILKKLSEEAGETVQLGVESQGNVLYLEKIDAALPLQIISHVGDRLPMHCSGLGKVLLAYMSASKVSNIVKTQGLRYYTDYTITTPQALYRELDLVRKQGYAVDNNEIMNGLLCMAFPVHDKERKVTYAISLSGLSNHLKGAQFEKCMTLLEKAAEDISAGLGYKG